MEKGEWGWEGEVTGLGYRAKEDVRAKLQL